MFKLLFCHYQPNGLGIKLLRLKPGVPGGSWGRDPIPGNRKSNSIGESDPLNAFNEKALEKSWNEEEAAKAALFEATKWVRIINHFFLVYLAQLEDSIEEAAALEADSSARSVLARNSTLEFKAFELEVQLLSLTRGINDDLHPAVEVLNIRWLISRIYKSIQKLEESPSKLILDDLQLLLVRLESYYESYYPNKKDNHPDENAQLQNEQLERAVQDVKGLVTTIKKRFPVIIVQTAIETVNATIDELVRFSPYDEDIIRRDECIKSCQSLLLNLLGLNGRYFRPYASRLGEKYPNNELLIAMQQAMDDINSLRRVIGYTEEEIHQSLMSKPNELEELNNLLNKLKNQLENELLPKAEMAINSNSTLFDSLSFRWFSEYKY